MSSDHRDLPAADPDRILLTIQFSRHRDVDGFGRTVNRLKPPIIRIPLLGRVGVGIFEPKIDYKWGCLWMTSEKYPTFFFVGEFGAVIFGRWFLINDGCFIMGGVEKGQNIYTNGACSIREGCLKIGLGEYLLCDYRGIIDSKRCTRVETGSGLRLDWIIWRVCPTW